MAKNQAYLRRKNKEDVVRILRQNSLSYSEIAKILQLSNPAIAKIADDLIEDNIIYRESESKGRGGIHLSLNTDLGYVFVVDFSRWQVEICAFDFAGNLLMKDDMACVNPTMEDIECLFAKLHEWQKGEALSGKELLYIGIASSGKIDKESGVFILNPRFKKLGNISMKKIFEEEFHCGVVVKNDINLALMAEKMYGKQLSNVDNALMLHIDIGTGAALMFNGKIYEGSNGFAGEIGYYKLNMMLTDSDDYHNMNYSNLFDSVSLFSVLSVVKREIFHGRSSVIKDWLENENSSWENVTIQMIQQAYLLQDELTVRVVNSSAKIIGAFARCMIEFLDLDKVVLSGSVIEFGREYLKNINEGNCEDKIVFSDLKENGSVLGAFNAGITEILKERL